MSASASDYVSFTQAGRVIGSGASVVRRLVREGHLPVRVLPGGRPRVSAQAIEQLAKQSVRQAAADSVPVRKRARAAV